MTFYLDGEEMIEDATFVAPHYNFCGTILNINEEKATIVTDLFDKKTMLAYAKKNCEVNLTDKEKELFSEYRGGGQGDYSLGMSNKIENIVKCLTEFPHSKRAIIMINHRRWMHYETQDAKCLREMHFYLEKIYDPDKAFEITDGKDTIYYKLNCTAFMRAQAVDIMPKNLYFTYYIMNLIKNKLQKTLEHTVELGNYTHFVTNLAKTRND